MMRWFIRYLLKTYFWFPVPRFIRWLPHNRLNRRSVKISRIAAVGGPNTHLYHLIASEITTTADGMTIFNSFSSIEDAISRSCTFPQWLFFDIDFLQDSMTTKEVVDHLLVFRLQYPLIAIALVSQDFRCDEVGTYRLQIADVSLRLPLTVGRFRHSLDIMLRNNKLWTSRVRTSVTGLSESSHFAQKS